VSQALYRKWRPQKFSELFGQDHIKKTLQNALTRGRITHAYLFSGPRGSGKTTTARLLAKSVNCSNFKDGEPCNKCSSCQEIQKSQSLDLIEIDAASNRGIEEIKDLREKIKFTPVKSKYKVYVIDEAHQLTREAFNALLKTLEEPPAHAIFVLATTEVHKIPSTILSRCQRFDFRRLSTSDLINRISYIAQKENLKIDPEAAKLIAQSASGSARDAESLLDLIISRGLSDVTKKDVEEILGKTGTEQIKELYEFLIKKDAASSLSILNQVSDEGKDLFQFSSDLIEFLREKLLANPSGTLVSWIKLLCQAQKEMQNTSLIQLPLELAIVEMIATDKNDIKEDIKEEDSNPGFNSGHISLDWDKLITEMKPENHSLCFILENCRPIEIKNGQVILGVDFKFHKDKLEEPRNRQKIESALKKVTGKDFKIICQVVKGIQKIKALESKNNNLVGDAKEIFEIEE
jgi:DNA polymerase-3 subunit gamma/tau